MAPAPYPDFRWFFRMLRVLPVVAVAALAGGVIGGFSIFAINLALTAPPNHGVPPEPGSKLASETTNDDADASATPKSPTLIRTFDAAMPAAGGATSASATAAPAAPARPASDLAAVSRSSLPAVAEPAPVSALDVSPAEPAATAMTSPPSGAIDGAIAVVHPQTNASNEPQTPAPQIAVTQSQQTSWPDALSREHRQISAQPATANHPAERKTTVESSTVEGTAAESAPQPAPAPGAKPDANADANADALRRHVAIKRPAPPAQRTGEMAVAHSSAHSLNHGRPLYDDYGRQDSREVEGSARTKYRAAKPQYDARRQPPTDVARSSDRDDGRLYDRSNQRDDDDSQDALPPQPPPVLPFFGLFGGGDRDGN